MDTNITIKILVEKKRLVQRKKKNIFLGGSLVIFLFFMMVLFAVPLKDWWIIIFMCVCWIGFCYIVIEVFFRMFFGIIHSIQLSDNGIIYKNFWGSLCIVKWQDKIFYGDIPIHNIGKFVKVICWDQLVFDLVIPPKNFIENIDEVTTFIKIIRKEKECQLLNCLYTMYCCDDQV
jgi:hypothetical protein